MLGRRDACHKALDNLRPSHQGKRLTMSTDIVTTEPARVDSEPAKSSDFSAFFSDLDAPRHDPAHAAPCALISPRRAPLPPRQRPHLRSAHAIDSDGPEAATSPPPPAATTARAAARSRGKRPRWAITDEDMVRFPRGIPRNRHAECLTDLQWRLCLALNVATMEGKYGRTTDFTNAQLAERIGCDQSTEKRCGIRTVQRALNGWTLDDGSRALGLVDAGFVLRTEGPQGVRELSLTDKFYAVATRYRRNAMPSFVGPLAPDPLDAGAKIERLECEIARLRAELARLDVPATAATTPATIPTTRPTTPATIPTTRPTTPATIPTTRPTTPATIPTASSSSTTSATAMPATAATPAAAPATAAEPTAGAEYGPFAGFPLRVAVAPKDPEPEPAAIDLALHHSGYARLLATAKTEPKIIDPFFVAFGMEGRGLSSGGKKAIARESWEGRGFRFIIGDDGKVKAVANEGSTPWVCAEDLAVWRIVGGDIAIDLKAEHKSTAKLDGPDNEKASPKPLPSPRHEKEVRRLGKTLTADRNPYNGTVERMAKLFLEDCFEDTDPELTLETVRGILRDVQSGAHSEALLAESINAAYSPRVRNRGKAFIGAAKRQIREAKS